MLVELVCIALVSLYVADVSRTTYKLCRKH
jgi:hypothetical protein